MQVDSSNTVVFADNTHTHMCVWKNEGSRVHECLSHTPIATLRFDTDTSNLWIRVEEQGAVVVRSLGVLHGIATTREEVRW